jgi:SAM-dependent methyltransferase
VFANPLPSEADIAKAFPADGKIGEYERPISRGRLARLFEPIVHELDVMNPPRDASVLDFGCGRGGFLDSMAHLGWSTYGIDPGAKVAFPRHTELTAIPDSPTFRLVVLQQVLEHVTEPLGILRQLGRATRQGGFILISVPNFDDVGVHGDFVYCIRSHTHVLAYTRQCLTWLLAAAGFRALKSVDDAGIPQRTIVIGRREEGPLPFPSRPLVAADTALRNYDVRDPAADTSPQWLPIRLRAALAFSTKSRTESAADPRPRAGQRRDRPRRSPKVTHVSS